MNMTSEIASLPWGRPWSTLLPLALCPGRLPSTDCILLLPHPVTSSRAHQWEPMRRTVSFLSSLLTETQAAVLLTWSSPPFREPGPPLQGLPLLPDWQHYVNLWGLLTLLLSYLYYHYFWCGPFLQSLFNLLRYGSCLMSWCFGHEVCGTFAPRPWLERTPPVLESEVLATGLPGKSFHTFINRIFFSNYYTSLFLAGTPINTTALFSSLHLISKAILLICLFTEFCTLLPPKIND